MNHLSNWLPVPLGFNRYMVECELFILTSHDVNIPSFNRYMVECECWLDISMVLCVRVLIDTWWNVNYLYSRLTTLIYLVLIDTWWNVNWCFMGCRLIFHFRFNRYMVECE